jgi:hypothetical protein
LLGGLGVKAGDAASRSTERIATLARRPDAPNWEELQQDMRYRAAKLTVESLI